MRKAREGTKTVKFAEALLLKKRYNVFSQLETNKKNLRLPHFCSSFFPLPFSTFSLLTLGTLVRPSLSRNSVEFPYPEPNLSLAL